MTSEVVPGVFRCGTWFVNWYLVSVKDGVTIVDAGLPGYRAQLPEAVRLIGRVLRDVKAIVLTHAHADHLGFAESWRRELDIPVYVHAADEEAARTGAVQKPEGSILPYLRYGGTYRLLAHFARYGPRIRPLRDTRVFADRQQLDVPGAPRVVHTPGHTRGHSALVFEDRGVVMVGDAFCTWHPLTGLSGPRLLPQAFNVDSAQALASLDRLRKLDASVTLCGHGSPWTATLSAAVAEVRRFGALP